MFYLFNFVDGWLTCVGYSAGTPARGLRDMTVSWPWPPLWDDPHAVEPRPLRPERPAKRLGDCCEEVTPQPEEDGRYR